MSSPAGQAAPTPLDQPLYGASIGPSFARFWRKYATFSGQASRPEYWWVVLVSAVVAAAASALSLMASSGDPMLASSRATDPGDLLTYVWVLATLVPSLAVAVRRLHDIDRSGWWLLITLVPVVGWIVLVVWNLTPPQRSGERFD